MLGEFLSVGLERLISMLFNCMRTYMTLFPISLSSVKNKVKRDQVIFFVHERNTEAWGLGRYLEIITRSLESRSKLFQVKCGVY